VVVKIRNKCVIFENDTSLLLVAPPYFAKATKDKPRDKCRTSRFEVKEIFGNGTSVIVAALAHF